VTRLAPAALVVALASSGCGAGTAGRPIAAPAAPVSPETVAEAVDVPEPKIVAAVFHPVDARPADTALTVAWETGKCQFFHSIDVDEAPDRVVVTVLERLKPDSLCPDAGLQASRTVRLRAPLGVRPIFNGGATPPLRLAP
jgi:hypothetical protein